MGDLDYLRDVPPGELLLERGDHRTPGFAVCTPDVARRLAHYDCSTPTAPSAGRIYARTEGFFQPGFPQPGARTWLFVVEDDPEDPKYQLHHPHLLEVIR